MFGVYLALILFLGRYFRLRLDDFWMISRSLLNGGYLGWGGARLVMFLGFLHGFLVLLSSGFLGSAAELV